MNLHQDPKSFAAAILSTSANLKIPAVFIEKDYWLSLVLKRLAQSQYHESVVFKGGTSLSKGFGLIDRFSEDIDIAVINVAGRTGNQVKNLIREVEKGISVDLTEILEPSVTSKGSRFRKSVYTYPSTGDMRFYQSLTNRLIIEINSFANPYPSESRNIGSLISSDLEASNEHMLIEKYDLLPFTINVLNKSQTLLEKLVSLFRASFETNPALGLSGKIRHFYDLHFLVSDPATRTFVDSIEFPAKFQEVWTHDQLVFEEPKGWQGNTAMQSPLVLLWPEIWNSLKTNYQRELSVLAYSPIPDEKAISDSLTYLIKNLFASHLW